MSIYAARVAPEKLKLSQPAAHLHTKVIQIERLNNATMC